ncbi:MAG TPA: hypothetical protein DHU69_01235 [Deltaproteobacteria bacterium]|nr:MAG: hypothetical protein A2056_01150 [Deltaproteobacteria bacterium GWA2_42_85]OGP27278.1 MAG: hypothetical protein A2067_01080 [Deltaproteobacteria bacterium GWB2_42_7]OGQ76225.1 MAG: hypothetical protein A2235_11950 [Deltaproteobacteria bacterium RIFOXYA2_FULL_42_10]HAG51276.1 hypothetical protein [Deltaproteobacteria bacterium]HCY18396.1 hypothetical protein [Deltaproteobacteria bacterium]
MIWPKPALERFYQGIAFAPSPFPLPYGERIKVRGIGNQPVANQAILYYNAAQNVPDERLIN